MGVQQSGLTLEGVVQRLEALEHENAQIRSENARLRDEVAALGVLGTHRGEPAEPSSLVPRRDRERASGFEGQVSRRSLLSKAGAAAVATVAAGTLLSPRQAKADHYDTSIEVDTVHTHSLGADFVTATLTDHPFAAVTGRHNGSGPGVAGIAKSITGTGVQGTADGSLGYGVRGTGFSGVWGEASHADGRGVMGLNTNGTGVKGQGNTGVLGVGSDERQAGVKGEGPTGVWGKSSRSNFAAVYGQHTGTTGMGVLGIGTGSDAGVAGENPSATGIGTYGECWGGTGVKGVSQSGYAGVFEGGKAQLKLKPGAGAGKPTTGAHVKGEIYMDSAGTLFVCTASTTSTTAAKWRKLSTTAV